ncbi:putative variant surface glycoprotein, (VSG) [Trypanosoma vivax]|nr:putative variant surface glycoprotein, (VSG) [Trypanosoma vivax]
MRTASLRTTFVCVLLAITLSGTAPDIFVRCAARGRPGGALLVEGGAQLICELSGALKKVRWYAENFNGKHGFSCLRDVVQRVKNSADALAYKIDAFVDKFMMGNQNDVICLADFEANHKKIPSTKNSAKLSGCYKHWYNINDYIHDVEEELNEKIKQFSGVARGESWKKGLSSVFDANTRGGDCPLTQHISLGGDGCTGELDQHGTPYGGLWEIKGVDYDRCGAYDCSCSNYYYPYPHPEIYWIGDGDSGEARTLRTLREDLKTLKEADGSTCTKQDVTPSYPQTQDYENSDSGDSRADGSDDVRGNADNIETEQQTGDSFGEIDNNATVVSKNHGDSHTHSETGGQNSRNNGSNSVRASTDNNASTVSAQHSPLHADIHISSNCRLGGVIFMFAGILFGKTFVFFPIR